MKIVFHAGAGKTGTSSIQLTLRQNPGPLAAHGVAYLGLVLEHAPVQRVGWQQFGRTEALHRLSDDDGAAQIAEVLQASADALAGQGVHTMVWSSESFFDRPAKALDALRRLRERGHAVQIVAYVRRHDRWLVSAYLQWGIKHKTMRGSVPPFNAWVARQSPGFARRLAPYVAAFPGQVVVRNLDAVGDAVADFLALLGLAEAGVVPHIENSTPANPELLLRALYNRQVAEPQLPMAYQRAMGRFITQAGTATDHLRALCDGDAAAVADTDAVRADVDTVDTMLARGGQPALRRDAAADDAPPEVSAAALLLVLAQVAMRQAAAIERLEARVAALAPATVPTAPAAPATA